MNTSALVMMLFTQLTVLSFTGYFFYRVLSSGKGAPEGEE
jgi:hypothetical protein